MCTHYYYFFNNLPARNEHTSKQSVGYHQYLIEGLEFDIFLNYCSVAHAVCGRDCISQISNYFYIILQNIFSG